jgi:hypothetical protein
MSSSAPARSFVLALASCTAATPTLRWFPVTAYGMEMIQYPVPNVVVEPITMAPL